MKTKLLAVIVLISIAGAATAVNTGSFQKNHTRLSCDLNAGKVNRSELHLKKLKRNKINLKKKWQKSENNRNKKGNICQFPEKTSFKTRRK
jgi:hypothetical protein